jgi:hypothetical protein
MFDRRQYILPMLPLSISEKEKLGKPKEEIGNLKMDLNLCILMISKYNICKLNICILAISKYNICKLNICILVILRYNIGEIGEIYSLLTFGFQITTCRIFYFYIYSPFCDQSQ